MTPEEKIKLLTQALESLLADIRYDGEASDRNIDKAEKILKAIKSTPHVQRNHHKLLRQIRPSGGSRQRKGSDCKSDANSQTCDQQH